MVCNILSSLIPNIDEQKNILNNIILLREDYYLFYAFEYWCTPQNSLKINLAMQITNPAIGGIKKNMIIGS